MLASKNEGKLSELRELLSGRPVEILSLKDFPDAPEVEEDGATFVENAVKKASVVAEHTGIVALADDSGLEVDALGGRPGVLSARFAGRHGDDAANNRLLLELMAGVPDSLRTARFRCAIAVAIPGGQVHTAVGCCEGVIGREPRGSGGFGYDPLFYMPAHGMTMAELPTQTKNRLSHRALAMRQAAEILKKVLDRQSGREA